jgi:hypothetical protein
LITYIHSEAKKKNTPPIATHTSPHSTPSSSTSPTSTPFSPTDSLATELKQKMTFTTTPPPPQQATSPQKAATTAKTTIPSHQQSPSSVKSNTTVTQHNADYATRVMNITVLDMKVLPPLFAWLDATPLSSFNECIADLKELEMEGKKVLTKLPAYVSSVKKRVTQMMEEETESLNLSIDERAAIYLYTMEFPPLPDVNVNGSIYFLMNKYLRDQNRAALKPFLKYLKLLLSALHKLPAVKNKVCRGVKEDIAAAMKSKEKKEITWNSFSSTTLNSKTLDNPAFLGTNGSRALFFIDCKSGRNISTLSACPSEDEILLFPCTSFKVEHVVIQGDLTFVNLTEVEPLEDFSTLFI